MDVSIAEEKDPTLKRRIVETLTARLPEWFAQGEANRHYARQAETLKAWVAGYDGRAVGLLLLKRHSGVSTEVYWLGLFVMTLHPDDPYEPYQRTRAFYERMGFELGLSLDHRQAGPSSDSLAYYLKIL